MYIPSLKNTGFPQWISDKFIYLMLVAFPLFTGFSGYGAITLSKFLFFSVSTVLWMASLLAWRLILHEKCRGFRLSAIGICLGLFAAALCISALASPHGEFVLMGNGRYDGLLTSLLYLCVFFGVSAFGRFKIGYAYALALSAGLCCVVGLFQLFNFNIFSLFPGNLDYYDGGTKYTGVFLGTLGNVDLFSAFLCLALPLLSAFYVCHKKRPVLLLPVILLCQFFLVDCGVSAGITAIFATLLLGAPLLLSSGQRLTRGLELGAAGLFATALSLGFHGEKTGGIVTLGFSFSPVFWGLMLGCALLLLSRYFLRNRDFKEKTLPRFFTVFSILLTLGGLVMVYFWQGTTGTIYEFSRLLHGEIEGSFGSSRIMIWSEGLKLVPESPLFGGGPGTFSLRVSLDFSRFVEATGQTLRSSVDNAHNFYLGTLVDSGLIALGLFLSAQFISVFKALRLRHERPWPLVLLCALGCYWVQDFFGLGLFLVSPLMWLLWGLLAAEISQKPLQV